MQRKRNKDIQVLINKANQYLSESDDSKVAAREVVIDFVSGVLHEVKCYMGFNFVYWDAIGFKEWDLAGRPEEKDQFVYGPSGDKTRIKFY